MAEIAPHLKAKLSTALREGDEAQAESLARQILDQGASPMEIVRTILVPTLTQVGQRFQDFEIFLPELMMAGEAAQKVTDLVESATQAAGEGSTSLGTILLGQVEGDLHDIGRHILRTLLRSNGFKVVDLGRDVAASAFLEAAEKEKADIIGLSALMTTTLPAQRRTINLFKEVDARDQYKIIVGGGAVDQAWADEIQADGYAPDAAAAVSLCTSLLNAES